MNDRSCFVPGMNDCSRFVPGMNDRSRFVHGLFFNDGLFPVCSSPAFVPGLFPFCSLGPPRICSRFVLFGSKVHLFPLCSRFVPVLFLAGV